MFQLFGFLPAELRLEIWRESCTPRVVEVRYSETQDRCLSNTKLPAVLGVCQEAREEGLRFYFLAFGTKTHPKGHIYFSPNLDILYVPRCGSMGYGDSARDFARYVLGTAPLVRSLAVDHVSPEIRRPWETYNKFCLMRNFPGLREAFLVLASEPGSGGSSDSDGYGQGQIEFVDPNDDKDAIMELMEGVKESFSYEVGQPVSFGGEKTATGLEAVEQTLPQFALIPKRKTLHPSMENISMCLTCN